MEIAAGIHLLKNSFVNMYLIDERDSLTLIDAGIYKSGPQLVLKKIAELGRKPQDLRKILITHSDGDHVGGAAELKKLTGAEIFASKQDGACLAEGKAGREAKGPIGWLAGTITKKIAPITAQEVDKFLNDADTLAVLDGLQVVSSPGHTPGHLAFFSPLLGLLFAGDAMNTIGKKIQFGDGPFTWDFALGKESVLKLQALGAKQIACGHGEPMQGDLVFPRF